MIRWPRSGEGPPVVPVSGWSVWLVIFSSTAMSFLAVLGIVAAVAAGRLALEWEGDLAGAATVRIAAEESGMEERLAAALAVLKTTPGIAAAEPLAEAEQRALLAPWLGDGPVLDSLPVPRLVDVALENGGPDPDGLNARLAAEAPGAVYETHEAWRAPLAEGARSLRLLAIGASLIVLTAAAAVVGLAARAALAGNIEIVRVIRLIGGQDRYIAEAFTRRLVMRAFAGGTIGSALGVLACTGLSGEGAVAELEIALLPGLVPLAIIALAIPLVLALAAWAVAAFSVRMALRRMP